MGEKTINFEDTKIKKSNFYKNKKILRLIKILVSKEESCGTKNSSKYFIGYNDDDYIGPLWRKLP